MNQTVTNVHTCECGNKINTFGWNNNMNCILRCEGCETKRKALIEAINEAISGKSVEMVYVSRNVFHLLDVSDFQVEISPRRVERMNGQDFQVVEN